MHTRSCKVEIPNGLSLPFGFRDEHSPDRVRSVSLLLERKRQFAEPSLDPIRFDVGEILAIHPRRALVGAALGVGMRQNIGLIDLVVQPFRYLHDCSGCFPLEHFAGWCFHPLESAAFARRTPERSLSGCDPDDSNAA